MSTGNTEEGKGARGRQAKTEKKKMELPEDVVAHLLLAQAGQQTHAQGTTSTAPPEGQAVLVQLDLALPPQHLQSPHEGKNGYSKIRLNDLLFNFKRIFNKHTLYL